MRILDIHVVNEEHSVEGLHKELDLVNLLSVQTLGRDREGYLLGDRLSGAMQSQHNPAHRFSRDGKLEIEWTLWLYNILPRIGQWNLSIRFE